VSVRLNRADRQAILPFIACSGKTAAIQPTLTTELFRWRHDSDGHLLDLKVTMLVCRVNSGDELEILTSRGLYSNFSLAQYLLIND
jgi:hypothetical protein